MCWNAEQRFPSANDSPAAARHFCHDQLSAVFVEHPRRADLLADVSLIASELVTNSLNAGAGAISVELEWHRGHLRLTVGDDAPGLPQLRHPSAHDVHGRGLAITAALSDNWGVRPPAPPEVSGKRVWAEIGIAADMTDTLRCTR